MREWTEKHINDLIMNTMKEHGVEPGEGGGSLNIWDDGIVDFFKYVGTANRLALLPAGDKDPQFDLLSVKYNFINEPHGPFAGPQSERRRIQLTMQRTNQGSLPAYTVMGKVLIPDIRTSYGIQRASGKPIEPVEWLQNNRITPNPSDLAGVWNYRNGTITISIVPSTYTYKGYVFSCYNIINNTEISMLEWMTVTKEVEL